MHILILASTSDIAAAMQTALGEAADRYTVTTSWADITTSHKDQRPDLIVVERAVLASVDLGTLNDLTEPGRWPPLLVVDSTVGRMRAGVSIIPHLAQTEPDYYQVADLHIDTRKRRARVDERWVTLPPIQYRLLLALARRAGEVIGCQELLHTVWGYEAEENEARELVKVHIRQIRRRMGLDPEKHHYIRSVRGFGYMLTSPDDD